MNPRVEGYVAAVLEDAATAGERASLASELAAIAELFKANALLASALTDTAVEPSVRRAVLDDLLAGKVSDGARRVAAFTAAAVPAPEVPAAVGWVAQRARQVSEGVAVAEEPLGHTAARARVGGYARAVFEQLAADRLEEVEDELFRFSRIVESTPELRSVLADREQPLAVRQGVVDQLLGGKVQPATLRLVDFTLSGGRARDLLGTLFWLVDETARARGWRVARVTTARDVDAQERERLAESLGHLTGQPVELQVTVDPALLAGARVRVGDLQVDATARGRIDELREHMSTTAWQEGPGVTTEIEPGTDAEGAR